MKQLFVRILGMEIGFTTTVEDFIKHTGPKITYTKKPLQNEFFVWSNDLLFEKGINALKINFGEWEGTPCFFAASEGSSIPFDIFSASFYLLSRYEEYLPHVKDVHGRFSPKSSLAFKHGFLRSPVVDLWAYKLWEHLQRKFPDMERPKRSFHHTSVIDVTTSHCFAYRGFFRGVTGFLLDLFTLKLKRISTRMAVWVNPKRDPYDNYSELIALHKEMGTHSMFFFQFADYSTYDKNVSPNSNRFKYLIKSIADYSTVSLAASYSSFDEVSLLRKEKKRLSSVVNRPVSQSRMRYNRVDVPETYRHLVDAEFTDDYTMGYSREIGFRAGTCTPFHFYDIPLETQQPIRVHPFAIHDYALVHANSADELLNEIVDIGNRVKKVNGTMVTVFSNELLGGELPIDWLGVYAKMLKELNG